MLYYLSIFNNEQPSGLGLGLIQKLGFWMSEFELQRLPQVGVQNSRRIRNSGSLNRVQLKIQLHLTLSLVQICLLPH